MDPPRPTHGCGWLWTTAKRVCTDEPPRPLHVQQPQGFTVRAALDTETRKRPDCVMSSKSWRMFRVKHTIDEIGEQAETRPRNRGNSVLFKQSLGLPSLA